MATTGGPGGTRAELMTRHVAARRRRDAAPLDSADYREACEEIAAVEIAIAALEEPRHLDAAAQQGPPAAG